MMASLQLDVDVSGLDIDDRTVPGPARRSRRARARLRARPAGRVAVPAILDIHGGGFVLGVDRHASTRRCGRSCESSAPSCCGRVPSRARAPLPRRRSRTATPRSCGCTGTPMSSASTPTGSRSTAAERGRWAHGGHHAARPRTAAVRRSASSSSASPSSTTGSTRPSMRAFVDTPMWNRGQRRSRAGRCTSASRRRRRRVAVRVTGARHRPRGPAAGLPHHDGVRPAARRGHPLRAAPPGGGRARSSSTRFPGTFHGSAMVTGAAVTQRRGRRAVRRAPAPFGLDRD